MPDQIVWLSTTQVAKRLGCGRTSAGHLIRQGTLPAVRAGANRWRVREDVVAAYQAQPRPSRSESHRAAGVLGLHRRWHVKRGVTKPECEHCRA